MRVAAVFFLGGFSLLSLFRGIFATAPDALHEFLSEDLTALEV
jgi:hypothetical protein